MDLQTILDNAVAAQRAESMKDSPQLTLGELILKLEAISDKEKHIKFDFGDKIPGDTRSWRGSYSELAIEYNDEGTRTVQSLLGDLKECVGFTFTGYKGGDYRMGRTTPVWVANYGDSGAHNYKGSEAYQTIAVTDIKDGEQVEIITQAIEY